MKITVIGAGYVGLSLATLLAQNHEVTIFDILEERINLINNRKSTIQDEDIQKFLANKKLEIIATQDKMKAYLNAKYYYSHPD